MVSFFLVEVTNKKIIVKVDERLRVVVVVVVFFFFFNFFLVLRITFLICVESGILFHEYLSSKLYLLLLGTHG